MKSNFKEEVLSSISNREGFSAQREIVISYKKKGCSKDDVYEWLEEVRNELTSEHDEDIVLDLMDVVAGFCAPRQTIWD